MAPFSARREGIDDDDLDPCNTSRLQFCTLFAQFSTYNIIKYLHCFYLLIYVYYVLMHNKRTDKKQNTS